MEIDAARVVAPERLRGALREAFVLEIQERLPRLEAGDDPEAMRRDAHTFGSSAYVIGEPELAELARAVERDLVDGPLPQLIAALRAWAP